MKIKVHPLFYLFGLYYAITGRIFIFLIYTFSALIHEIGHSIIALDKGYRLNRITLTPFGAVVSGNIDGLKCKDEIAIALFGPVTNLLIATLFVAGWWVYPEIYPYTDIIVLVNLSLGIINLLPAYPLDGGRVLSSLLKMRLDDKKAQRIARAVGIVISLILFAFFIYSVFVSVNVSALFFSLFIFLGAIDKKENGEYKRIAVGVPSENYKRGVLYKKQAVDKNITVKGLLRIIDINAINEIVITENKKPIATLTQEEIEKIIVNAPIYSEISEYIK